MQRLPKHLSITILKNALKTLLQEEKESTIKKSNKKVVIMNTYRNIFNSLSPSVLVLPYDNSSIVN